MLNVWVGLCEPYDNTNTMNYFRSFVMNPLTMPFTMQILEFALSILACLTPQEATTLLDSVRRDSSSLCVLNVWNEPSMLSCGSHTSTFDDSSVDAGISALATGEDEHDSSIPSLEVAGNNLNIPHQSSSTTLCVDNIETGVTSGPGPLDSNNNLINWDTALSSEISKSSGLPQSTTYNSNSTLQDISHDIQKDRNEAYPHAAQTLQPEKTCGSPNPAQAISQASRSVINNSSPSKVCKRQSPKRKIKHRSSLSVDLASIPTCKHSSDSTTSSATREYPIPCSQKETHQGQFPTPQVLETAGDTSSQDENLDATLAFATTPAKNDSALLRSPMANESQVFAPAADIFPNSNGGDGKKLNQSELTTIIDVGNSKLFQDNFAEFFSVHSNSWMLNEWQGDHNLGIPLPDFTSNREACVAYFKKALEWKQKRSEKKQVDLSPVGQLRRRVTQIWLYLFFEEFVKELQGLEDLGKLDIKRNGRPISTIARDLILADIHGDIYTGQKSYRDSLTGEVRWGDRWWITASCIGLGVVLLPGKQLASNIGRTQFRNGMVDGLINYILRTYPRVVSVFEVFGPFAHSLILGKGFCSLYNKADISDLLDRLTETEQEQHISCSSVAWQGIDPGVVAMYAATNFMCSRKKYFHPEY